MVVATFIKVTDSYFDGGAHGTPETPGGLAQILQQRASLQGVIPSSRLDLVTQPQAGDFLIVGAVTYELVSSTPPVAGNPAHSAIYLGANAAATQANAVKAIHGTVDAANVTPGTVAQVAKVKADIVSGRLRVQLATKLNGTPIPGVAPSIPLTASLTTGKVWNLANLNAGAGKKIDDQLMSKDKVVVTVAMITAGAYWAELPFTPGPQSNLDFEVYAAGQIVPTNDVIAFDGNAVKIAFGGGGAPNLQVGDTVVFTATL